MSSRVLLATTVLLLGLTAAVCEATDGTGFPVAPGVPAAAGAAENGATGPAAAPPAAGSGSAIVGPPPPVEPGKAPVPEPGKAPAPPESAPPAAAPAENATPAERVPGEKTAPAQEIAPAKAAPADKGAAIRREQSATAGKVVGEIVQPPVSAQAEEVLLFPEPYVYVSEGRRDLFASLLAEDAAQSPNGEPTSSELRVVGILWAENDRFALVETGDGRSLLLREGDLLGDGVVYQVLPDRVIVHVTEFGSSRKVTLPVAEGGSVDVDSRWRPR